MRRRSSRSVVMDIKGRPATVTAVSLCRLFVQGLAEPAGMARKDITKATAYSAPSSSTGSLRLNFQPVEVHQGNPLVCYPPHFSPLPHPPKSLLKLLR